MASVIHSLWEKGDRSPLILPASLPIDDSRVQPEFVRYLPDNWMPVIEKDVDGRQATPLRIDGEIANLGKHSACRRVARTVYLGSAPTAGAPQRGLEDRRIKLGCVLPGESPSVFGDALRRLGARATYLYQDGPRYWYDTRPTVTKLAEDRAEQCRRDPDRVAQAIGERLRVAQRETEDFSRIHTAPQSGHDVPDERETRLVVLGIDHPHRRDSGSAAQTAAAAILESRGTTPRLYRNTVVFLAPDQTRLQDLDEAVRQHLAWESILADRDVLDLSPHQVRPSRDATGQRRRSGQGPPAGNLPVAADTGPGDPGRSGHLGGGAADRTGIAGGSGGSPVEERRSAGDELRRDEPADGARPGAAVARRPRARPAGRRGLRKLPVPAAPSGAGGAAARRRRRRPAADLGGRGLRLRGQLRRRRGAVSRPAGRTGALHHGRGRRWRAGQAGHRPPAARRGTDTERRRGRYRAAAAGTTTPNRGGTPRRRPTCSRRAFTAALHSTPPAPGATRAGSRKR